MNFINLGLVQEIVLVKINYCTCKTIEEFSLYGFYKICLIDSVNVFGFVISLFISKHPSDLH